MLSLCPKRTRIVAGARALPAAAGRGSVFLPSDGTVVSANLRNLNPGGICLDTNHPMDPGARTEVLVSVNAASFRSIGLVKAIVENSRACMEFVHMSASSKDTGGLARANIEDSSCNGQASQWAHRNGHRAIQGLEKAGVRTAIYGGRIPAIRRTLNEKSSESALVTEPTRTRNHYRHRFGSIYSASPLNCHQRYTRRHQQGCEPSSTPYAFVQKNTRGDRIGNKR